MRGLAKLFVMQLKLYLREPVAFFFSLAYPALLLLLFGFIFGNDPSPDFWGVNFGINRPDISDKHWIYYPEKEYLFHRISFPMNFSSSLVPPGTSSITVEVAGSRHKPINQDTMVADVIRDLLKTPFLESEEEIISQSVLELNPAYVIYHIEHREDVVGVEHLEAVDELDVLGEHGPGAFLVHAHRERVDLARLEHHFFDVEDDVGHVLDHVGDGGELMQSAVDADGRGGCALQRGEQHAA